MFGHQNNDEHQNNDNASAPAEPASDGVLSQTSADNPALPNDNVVAPQDDTTAAHDDSTTSRPDDTPAFLPVGDDPTPLAASSDQLLDIKQQALTQLTPLVGHLDQSPEEKFRTTMMMIQASDNQTLVKDAYEAAQQISDEKVKAQALLDIVNEINYFTQHHES